MPSTHSAIFAALGDDSRLRLIECLAANGAQSVSRLTEAGNISRQAVTKHLQVMEEAGLVSSERRGRERVWHLERKRIKDARRFLKEISNQWDDALDRLKKLVEKPPH